ncbi:transposase [Endozoicomonas gorgoniicola]|uniref:Transposase n=1 Tax=Endozoicomonas gorgoniicola TaxID=1234144 RepID=A0ABT3N2L6_9GAMM|nr:transposase [Endozoicomonas gorgoniicola]MCW7555880.1 transposase [Endozoicomonas gorgoniicola]
MESIDQGVTEYLRELIKHLAVAPRGDKGRIVAGACECLGRSEDWVYRQLKNLGYQSNRKRRSDSGQSELTEDECRNVANLLLQSNRENNKRLMTIENALELARSNALISSAVSVSTATRQMKRYQVHPDQVTRPAPYQPMASKHPNHVWQFDVSYCVLYYLRNKEGLRVMNRQEFYDNKPQNLEKIKNERVLRYLVTDHTTGAFYLEYFVAPGESTDVLIRFLINAFHQREGKDPFHGVPFMLVWDAGTANISSMAKHFLDNLQVNHQVHTPGNPRAKGQVERTHDLVERHFEARLSFMQVDSIEELNSQAQRWMRWFNGEKKHTRHGHTRYGLWQTIRQEQLRLAPSREICKELLRKHEPVTRVIQGDLTVSYTMPGYGSMKYSVKDLDGINAGDELKVTFNPYYMPKLTVIIDHADGRQTQDLVEPLKFDEYGFVTDAAVYGEEYKSKPDKQVDKNRKQMNREAYGVETDQEVKAARKKRTPAFEGRVDPMADVKQQEPNLPDYMSRKGTDLPVEAPRTLSALVMSATKAQKLIRDTFSLSPEQTREIGQLLRERFPDGIPEEELNPFVEEVIQNHDQKNTATG